jgi:hypothetical protein
MKHEIISSLAIGMLVVVAAQVIISWRTGNWAFTSSSQQTAQRLFEILSNVVDEELSAVSI